MANPLLMIGGAIAVLYFMTKKSDSSASKPVAVLPAGTMTTSGTSTQVQVPVPGSNETATVTVKTPSSTVTSPLTDGTGWTLADDGSNSLAIKSPDGTAYHVTRLQVVKTPDGSTTVAIRPDLIVLNPKILAVATEATPPGTNVAATATTSTPQQVATQVIPNLVTQATQVAQKVLSTQASNVLTPPVAVQVQEVNPTLDTNGTIALAAQMINAESSKGWKTALSTPIKAWQSKMKLTADGKFGPKSALLMANEVGILPLIRYYASTGGSQAQQLAAYRTALGALASQVYSSNPAHSIALRSSQNYEQGQGYSTSPAAVPATARVAQAAALTAALKGA